MVATSDGNRVLGCSDWQDALTSFVRFVLHAYLIDLDPGSEELHTRDEALSVRDNRIMIQLMSRLIYVISLNEDRSLPTQERTARQSFNFEAEPPDTLARRLELFEGCAITTYTVSLGALLLLDFYHC